MAKNSIITSQGNVQFINSKGRTINIHPMHCYAVYEKDTVSFLFIYMKDYSGQAFFTSQYDDVEVNGESYDNIDDLKDAINYAFAKAGAQARTEIVDELPEDPFTNTIYLLPKEHGEGYDEYIWNEDEGWQLIGDTDIEFDRYLQITVFNEYSAATKQYIDNVSGNTVANHNDIVALSGAVDTEISARTDADAALSGAIDTVSSALTNETSARTAADTTLQNNIDTANGRIDAEQLARAQADTAISGAVDTLSGTVLSALTEDETVLGHALNDINGRINTVSGDVITLGGNVQTLSGKVDTISGSAITSGDVQTQIDNSISGKADKTEIYTYVGTDRINVSTAGGVRRKSIDLNIPIYSGSGVSSLSLTTPIGTAQGGNQIKGYFSTGIGLGLTTNNSSEVATGQYNISNTVGGASWGDSGNTLFSVGNGNHQGSEHNAFEIRQNGDIYITSGGTASSGMIKLQDQLGGGSITIDPSLDSGSTNPVANSAITSAFDDIEDRISEDEEVTASGLNALNDKFGGLKLMKITQAAYDALTVKDNNTLYIVIDS